MEPNGMPPIQPTTRPGVPQSVPNDQLAEAERYRSLARAHVDAEQSVTKFIDVMRRAGKDWQDISKYGEMLHQTEMKVLNMRKGEEEAWKRMAPEMNLSIEQIRKMPVRDLAKNMGSLSGSLLNLMSPVMMLGTVGTVAAATLKGVVDSLGNLNKAAATFALSRGDVRGAIDPSFRDRRAANITNASMNLMGFNREQTDAARGSLAYQVQMNSGQAMSATMAAGGMAAITGESASTIADRIGEALKSGVSLREFNAVFDHTRDKARNFGTSVAQASAQTYELWANSRSLGTGMTDANKTVERFSGMLNKGIVTLGDLQNLDPARRQFTQNAQMIQLARLTGQSIPGVTDQADFLKSMGHLMRMPQEERTSLTQRIYSSGVRSLAGSVGGADDERQQAIRSLLLQGPFGTGSSGLNLAIQQGTSLRPGAVDTRDAETVGKFAREAAAIAGSTADMSKTLGMAVRGLKDFTDAAVNAASRLSEGSGGLSAPVPDPDAFSRYTAERYQSR